jgi:hypothetical protein
MTMEISLCDLGMIVNFADIGCEETLIGIEDGSLAGASSEEEAIEIEARVKKCKLLLNSLREDHPELEELTVCDECSFHEHNRLTTGVKTE